MNCTVVLFVFQSAFLLYIVAIKNDIENFFYVILTHSEIEHKDYINPCVLIYNKNCNENLGIL